MGKIRVLIITGYPIVSEGLESFLNDDPDILIMGIAGDGKSGLEMLRQLNPDMVILDPALNDLDGYQMIQMLLNIKPDLKILLFSNHTDENFVYQTLRYGAHGYLLKEATAEELLQSIHYIYEGGYWVGPQFSADLVANYLKGKQKEDQEKSTFERLSNREREVFELIVYGKETKEISEILCISETTVAKHRISLMRKLDMKNSVELTKYAIRNGQVEA
jgi:two-component system, NarL family, response regulator NreC